MDKLTKQQKEKVVDDVIEALGKVSEDVIIGIAEDFTCDDDDGISDLDIDDMKSLIADEIMSRILLGGWTLENYLAELAAITDPADIKDSPAETE